jgi:methylmalonyl-CoA/ethylmalonyl-CoA epimerase
MNINSKWALHHIGIAVAEIAPVTEAYTRMFGYTVESPVTHDPVQTAYVQFLRLPGEQSYLEFVAPDGPQSKLAAAVKKGGGLNHMCYGVRDIQAAVTHLRDAGLVLLCEPVAAVAFPGRRIAWLMGPDHVPVELVEQGEPGQI